MRAAPHPRQAERLEALHRYEILDTQREAEFDEIVALAATICGTSISVVNLIDEDRQWFKAEVGLGVRETPLETSICSHVILSDDFVEITDTHSDPRTQDNPLCVADDGLRFYAGVLLKSPEGLPIGTLCVLHDQPHELNDFQKGALRTLARQVMRELDLRVALRDQLILRREMDHRVKNSLQSVASLIHLYRARASKDSFEAFDAVERKVNAISLLHEQLHEASDLQTVQIGVFLTRVLDLLQGSAPENVKIRGNIDALDLNSSDASSLGMIVSEFVANSIKHGFADGRPGDIEISMHREADGHVTLLAMDNGAGNGAGPRHNSAVEGLGQRLVEAAASQLGGTLERNASPKGYEIKLVFQAR